MIPFLFWSSALILFYIYFGYPILLWIWGLVSPKPIRASLQSPSVSILMSVFNEEEVIAKKMENLLSLDYPKEKMEILVGSDGSTDKAEEILKRTAGERVRFFSVTPRRGKPRMLNLLAQQAKGEILIFTDARQKIDSRAVRQLVKNFSDPSVGCVSGELVFEKVKGSVGEGVGVYWRYEKFIRTQESRIDSVIGATGALYAVRRALCRPIPEETILDDLYLPMQVVAQGYRTLLENEAEVYDDTSATPRQEYERKVRTLAGNYQSFAQLSWLLNPLKSRVAVQFISHKLLRILAPFFLMLFFISNLFLLGDPLARICLIAQTAFYLFALVGAAGPHPLRKIFSAPYVFCLLNLSALAGLYRYLLGRQQVTWKKVNGLQCTVYGKEDFISRKP